MSEPTVVITKLLPGQKGYWRALYNKMLEDLENDSWRRMQSYQIAGRMFSYRNLEGYLNLLKMVETKADEEDRPYRGRTYAGQGGRG